MMLSGVEYTSFGKINKKSIVLMKTLLNFVLKKEETTLKIDEYIRETAECFLAFKQEIILDLYELFEGVNKEMSELIMYEGNKKRKSGDYHNLFRAQIFGVFKNLKTIIIMSTHNLGYSIYTFSLSVLLSLLESISVEKVIVKAVVVDGKTDSWISELWNSSKTSIKQKYKDKNYEISYKRIKNSLHYKEDRLEIMQK